LNEGTRQIEDRRVTIHVGTNNGEGLYMKTA